MSRAAAAPRRSRADAATTFRRSAAKDDEQKVLPVLGNSADSPLLKELHELESFFGMSDEQVSQSVLEMFARELPPKVELARLVKQERSEEEQNLQTIRGSHSERKTEDVLRLSQHGLSSPSGGTGRKLQLDSAQGQIEHSGDSPPPPVSPTSADGRSPCSSPNRSMQATGMPWNRARAVNARDFSLGVASAALEQIASAGTQMLDVKAAKNRVHRPVTPLELAEASKPRAIAVPPIFQRLPDSGRESHYAFFARKIPGERPDHRRIMWGRAACARKVYHFNEIIGTAP